MIKVPVVELKNFLSKAKDIKSGSKDVDALRYIKISCDGDVATLTKTSLESFIVHQIEAKFNKNFVLLIDEEDLKTASDSDMEEVKITFKDQKSPNTKQGMIKMISIEDGHLLNMKCQAGNEADFPVIPIPNKDEVYNLSPDIVQALFMAGNSALSMKVNETPENYIHIKSMGKKKCSIAGYDRTTIFYKTFKDSLPDMIVEPAVSHLIAPYQAAGVVLYKNEKYNFFDAGTTLFGFIQSELKVVDFEPIIKMMNPEKSFTVDRKSIISFCTYALKMNKSSMIIPCFFKNGEEEKVLVLDFENKADNRANKAEIEVKKNKRHVIQKFVFTPASMISLLKYLSFEKVTLVGPCNKNFYVISDEDPDYVGAIREYLLTDEQIKIKEE